MRKICLNFKYQHFIVLCLVPWIIYFIFLGATPLLEPEELRYSAISDEMNIRGDYITPHLKGVVYFEKPPLCYWITAASFRLFSKNEFSARLFTALCAWGCILLVYRMGLYLRAGPTGLYAAAILSTCIFHVLLGRFNVLDMPLAFFISLAIWCGYRYLNDPMHSRYRIYLCYLFCALAFLTKGLIGVVFPFAILFLWLCVLKRWRDILRLISPVGIAILLAVSLPWLIAVQKANPDFLRFFFIQEHFQRYTTTMHLRYGPVYFFVPVLLLGIMPWLGFLPAAIKCAFDRGEMLFEKDVLIFLGIWISFVFVFFSFSSSKMMPYIAPLFIPLALIMGRVIQVYADGLMQVDVRTNHLLDGIFPFVQTALGIYVLTVPVISVNHHISLSEWGPYIAIPVFCLVLLMFAPRLLAYRFQHGWFVSVYLIGAVALTAIIMPIGYYNTPSRSVLPLVDELPIYLPRGELLYQYDMSSYGLDFYTGLRTPVINYFDELEYGISQLSDRERIPYYITSQEFLQIYRSSKRPVYCVTFKPKKLAELLGKDAPKMNLLWHYKGLFLLRLEKEQGKMLPSSLHFGALR